jgi:protein phosphatase
VIDDLRRAAEIGDSDVRLAAEQPGAAPLMGSTLSLAVWIWPKLFVSHVGDSRCYLSRGGAIERLTTDHTVGERLRELDKNAAAHAPAFDHMLWNAIGGGTQGVLPEVKEIELEAGDIVVLATDGLTKHVSDERIAAALDPKQTAREMCRALVSQANAAGGSDNVAVVVARSFAQQS